MTSTAGVVLALVVCAWFVLGEHQAVDQDHAESLIAAHTSMTPALAAHASALLRSAGTLNPDRQITLDRSAVALASGNTRTAAEIVAPVIRAESENLAAWIALARTSSHDPTLFYEALINIRRLDPKR